MMVPEFGFCLLLSILLFLFHQAYAADPPPPTLNQAEFAPISLVLKSDDKFNQADHALPSILSVLKKDNKVLDHALTSASATTSKSTSEHIFQTTLPDDGSHVESTFNKQMVPRNMEWTRKHWVKLSTSLTIFNEWLTALRIQPKTCLKVLDVLIDGIWKKEETLLKFWKVISGHSIWSHKLKPELELKDVQLSEDEIKNLKKNKMSLNEMKRFGVYLKFAVSEFRRLNPEEPHETTSGRSRLMLNPHSPPLVTPENSVSGVPQEGGV